MRIEGLKVGVRIKGFSLPDKQRIMTFLSWFMLVVSVVFFMLVMVQEFFPWDLPYDFYIVYGGSMSPTVKAGSLAVVGPQDPGELRVGDIITYRQSEGSPLPTTHRISEITEEGDVRYFATKGDGNQVADQGRIKEDDIEGRLIFFIPCLGYVISFIGTRFGRLLLLVLPLLAMMLFEVRKVINMRRRAGGLRHGD
jgi:signal peptidase